MITVIIDLFIRCVLFCIAGPTSRGCCFLYITIITMCRPIYKVCVLHFRTYRQRLKFAVCCISPLLQCVDLSIRCVCSVLQDLQAEVEVCCLLYITIITMCRPIYKVCVVLYFRTYRQRLMLTRERTNLWTRRGTSWHATWSRPTRTNCTNASRTWTRGGSASCQSPWKSGMALQCLFILLIFLIFGCFYFCFHFSYFFFILLERGIIILLERCPPIPLHCTK